VAHCLQPGAGSAKLVSSEVTVPSGDYGPVPVLMSRLLTLARSGGLDALLLTSEHFYQTDYSKPLLFLSGRRLLPGTGAGAGTDRFAVGNDERDRAVSRAGLALALHPLVSGPGDRLGEQRRPAGGGGHDHPQPGSPARPLHPRVRDIPRWIPVHKLIWRQHYRNMQRMTK